MSLDGILIERLPYEDQRYSDAELVQFRRLCSLYLSNSSSHQNQYKQDVLELVKPATQKLQDYIQETSEYINSLLASATKMEVRLAQLKALEEQNNKEIEIEKKRMVQIESEFLQYGIDITELAKDDEKEKHFFLQYGIKRDNQPQSALSAQTDECDTQMTTTSVVKKVTNNNF
jgi:hypothetical protein